MSGCSPSYTFSVLSASNVRSRILESRSYRLLSGFCKGNHSRFWANRFRSCIVVSPRVSVVRTSKFLWPSRQRSSCHFGCVFQMLFSSRCNRLFRRSCTSQRRMSSPSASATPARKAKRGRPSGSISVKLRNVSALFTGNDLPCFRCNSVITCQRSSSVKGRRSRIRRGLPAT